MSGAGGAPARAELLQAAGALLRDWTCAATALLPEVARVEAHTHLGRDSDGSTMTLPQLLGQLDAAAIDVALSAPLHHPEGYDDANRELLDWAAQSAGRVLPLWRVDPRRPDAAADAARGLTAGAVGLKLHPRAEQFSMADPGVRDAVREAAAVGGLVLIHAGRGMAALGQHTVDLARELPDATFILAHAAVSDLSWLPAAAADIPNVVFDTSWWNPVDLAALLCQVPVSRVLFAADPPYGESPTLLVLVARLAAALEFDNAELAAMFGGNAARLLGARMPDRLREVAAAAEPAVIDARRPVGASGAHALDAGSWPARRCTSYLIGALSAVVGGGDGREHLELAMRALDLPATDPAAGDADRLQRVIGLAHRILDTATAAPGAGDLPGEHPEPEEAAGPFSATRRAAITVTLLALAHAATFPLGVPELPAALA